MTPKEEKQTTIDDLIAVNRELESADFSFADETESTEAALTPAQMLQMVCRAYRIIKPFLSLVLGIPFVVPEAIKTAIRRFMAILNPICP